MPPVSAPSGPAAGFLNGLEPESKFPATKPHTSMHPKSRHYHSSGFTLTELLVVIVIIATLAALSMIGIKRMRDMADKTGAVRNLSQLQIANVGYASDNAGKYVPKHANDSNGQRTWWFRDPEFLNYFIGEGTGPDGKAAEIPLNYLDQKVVRAKRNGYKLIAASFGINHTGLPSAGTAPNASMSHTVASVTEPSRSMAFATATDLEVLYGSRLKWFSRSPEMREGKTNSQDLAYRHGDKLLVVYFDGHAGEMTKADILEIDKKGGANNVFWKAKQ
jgi:prepilin-type N-terminal cleavage/methylation domain-containing protein